MPSLLAIAGYALFSFLYFLPLPLKGQLPGNTDTLLAIALANTFVEKVRLGMGIGTSMYPSAAVYAYGENCAGLGFLYMFFRALAGGDIWGYYLFISTLFTLNSFALFKLTGLFVRDRRAAFAAGLTISFASFALANVDDPNVVFLFFPVMAWYFLERGTREKNDAHVRTGALLSGLQIWFGLYVFIFQAAALAFFAARLSKQLALFRGADGGRLALDRRRATSWALAFLGPTLPLLVLYIFNARTRGVVSVYDNTYIVRAASLSWQYFLNVLPGNVFYSALKNLHRGENLDVASWYVLRKTCFPGVLFPVLGALGMFSALRSGFRQNIQSAPFYLALGAVFLLLSLGAGLPFFGALADLPFGGYLRVPLRFYFFALIPLALFFAAGIDWLLGRVPDGTGSALVALIAIIYVAENAPLPLQGYAYGALIAPSPEYAQFFARQRERQIVVDLPSTYRARLPDGALLWTYNREALYMNWQTQHRQLIVGGVNGYLPESRVQTQKFIDRLPAGDAITSLKQIGVSYLVFHRNLVLGAEENILEGLKHAPGLAVELDSGDTTILRVL